MTNIEWTNETWNPIAGCSKVSDGCKNEFMPGKRVVKHIVIGYNITMKRHPNFKTGKSKTQSGYILVFVGVKHHLADVRGYAYEHRLEAEKKYGRRLKRGEHVHHIDGDKSNNSFENLEILTPSEHRYEHRKDKKSRQLPNQENYLIECSCGCGEPFLIFDELGRPRKFVSGHNPPEAETQDAIMELLKTGNQRLKDLDEKLDFPLGSIKCALTRLVKKNQIVRVSHGIYSLQIKGEIDGN